MFKRLAAAASAAPIALPNAGEMLLSLHPLELTDLLETAWNLRANGPQPTGDPSHRSDTPGLAFSVVPTPSSPVAFQQFRLALANSQGVPLPQPGVAFIFNPNVGRFRWDHLIYAYMIENTRIYEIFRRVVHELLHGEKLGSPRQDTLLWLRATEELFYRAQPPFFITTLDSHIRPDLRATRRNAYQRMFGMDLNHGTDDNTAYPYVKADAANNEFVATFVDLLREIEIARTHFTATAAVNPTDDAKIAEISSKVHDMLITRRRFGNLSREEFTFVSMMAWFHLTVFAGDGVPVIRDLRAEASSPEQRLFKIAQRVGLPAHGRSRGFFEIAEPISALLIAIETGLFNTAVSARAYYDPTIPNNPLPTLVNTVSTHWDEISPQKIRGVKVVPA